MSRKIIIDCDNAFSIKGCYIDDGLAIIYTLAQNDVELLGITTTFGNNTLDVIYPNTIKFMKDIGHPEIQVYRGSEDSYENNEAARFLVDMANRFAGELCLIVLGSTTNLYHAWLLDKEFYNRIKSITLMGGITKPLIIHGMVINELNFSCNYKATLNVLEHGDEISIATGNTCLDAVFTRERFEKLKEGNKFEKWLYENSLYWFCSGKHGFNHHGIYLWDVFATASLLNPDLFIKNEMEISPDEESIKKGMLIGNGHKRKVTIPKVKDAHEYIEHVYKQFRIFGEKR